MERLPLSALLSQVLVAFVIEVDNEFEHRMQDHRITRSDLKGGKGDGPWLTSLVMWSNCLRFIGEDGLPVGCLQQLARTDTNMHGMQRWGWVTVAPDPADTRSKPPASEWVIRATPAAVRARKIWPPLLHDIEQRWRERFGIDVVEKLQEALTQLAGQLDPDLPYCLPILQYGLVSSLPARKARAVRQDCNTAPADLTLAALLSKVLLAFALEFEAESPVSLAIAANVLRLTGRDGVRVRDLPALSGVSKELIAVAIGFLERRGFGTIQPESSGSRIKILTLTPRGAKAGELYTSLVQDIEIRWQDRFGVSAVASLREPLEQMVGDSTRESSPLFRGLEPHADCWRASVRKPDVLPHYPAVTHRGGFPDGS